MHLWLRRHGKHNSVSLEWEAGHKPPHWRNALDWLSVRRLARRLTSANIGRQLPVMATETTRVKKQQHNSVEALMDVKYFLYVKSFTSGSKCVFPTGKISSFIFMADSVVVVVDSRCWVLVARATGAMALRPHQGNCCYPPAPFPPPWLLRLAENCQIILKSQDCLFFFPFFFFFFYYKAPHAHLWKISVHHEIFY